MYEGTSGKACLHAPFKDGRLPKRHMKNGSTAKQENLRFFAKLMRFGLLATAAWGVLWGIWACFPFLRPGASLVIEAKITDVRNGALFEGDEPRRVVILGNSQVLTGFMPAVFNQALGEGSASYNLGLPGLDDFIYVLEELEAVGQAPTHAILTVPWPAESTADAIEGDQGYLEWVFPFRSLVRDLALFLLRSRTRGGPSHLYAANRDSVQKMRAARGYYFIVDQSHFPDHRLPNEFAAPGDTPDKPVRPRSAPDGPLKERLLAFMERAGTKIAFVPYYVRENSRAQPPPHNTPLAEQVSSAGVVVLGPDYYRFPNRYFSDIVHLNAEGAREYTLRLADLVRPFVVGDPR
jgi:hypothetical protein